MVNKKRKIEVKELNDHLICVLCSGYFIDATTITGCLHTFCRSCIRKQLNIKAVCPTCEKSDPNFCPKSSPKLRHDRTLQALVYKIVPGLYKRELSCRVKFVKENAGLDDRIVRWSDEIPKEKRALACPGFSREDMFSICLRRQTSYIVKDGDSTVDIQSFLLCPGHVSIAALKKFILMKLGLLKDWQVIFFNAFDSFSDGCTLVDVAYIKRWDKVSPLVLDYYLINPYQNCFQLTKSVRKRPRVEFSSKKSNSAMNSSVRITESSPTSGIKIRIKLSESIRKEGRPSLNDESHNAAEEPMASSHSSNSVLEIKQEMFSPPKEGTSRVSDETRNGIEGADNDFEPPLKRPRTEERPSSNNNINSDENNDSTLAETILSKKKPGRPKRKGSTYGKLSILSLLKRRSSQEPQIKKELSISPEKNQNNPTNVAGAGLKSILSESIMGDRVNNLSNGVDENTSIVTFREDNPNVMQGPSQISRDVQPQLALDSVQEKGPIASNTALELSNNSVSALGVENVSKNVSNAQKFAEVPAPSQPSLTPNDLQRLLLLAQQPNLLMQNPDILAAYSQKLCELLGNLNAQKSSEGMPPLPQQSSIQIGGNLPEGQSIQNGDMFALNKQPQVPDYLNHILYGQQVPQMLLSYPQVPLQPFVISPGYECNLMQNILASNQKAGMEGNPLSQDQISPLTVPLPYNLVYPSVPQYVPDCASYYMGQALHQMGNPFENSQVLTKPMSNYNDFTQGFAGEKMLREKSFLSGEGMTATGVSMQRISSVEQLANQIEGQNGCAERPLFSPMSVDEDDKRAGLIPESALDPSKEVGVEKCDILLNGSHTSDVSV